MYRGLKLCCIFLEALQHNSNYRTRLKASIFAYQDREGYNCLVAPFDSMVRYGNRNNLNFSIEQFNQNNLIFRDSFQIEAMVEYLIQLGDQHKLNLAQILNHKTKNGTTLFYMASSYSEKFAKILIQRNIRVNTVDQKFMTPELK